MANNYSFAVQERLSALVDGELAADEIGALLDAMDVEPAAYEAWTLHHANAAAIRGEQINATSGDMAFWQSLQKRLDSEPQLPALAVTTITAPLTKRSGTSVANEPFWLTRSLASVAIVVAVGGLAAVFWPAGSASDQIAAAANVTAPIASAIDVTDGNVMLRDPALDALMAAHQQMGGHSAWQAPSGFLRNATYERPAR